MSFELQIAHSVDEIGQANWDRLSAGRPFASFRWYSFGEQVLASQKAIYVIVHHGGQPIARGTFWLSRNEPLEVHPAALRYAMSRFISRRPLLLCRSPLSSSSGLTLPDSSLRQAALAQIIEAARQQAQKHRASFTLYDYLTSREINSVSWPADFNYVQINEPGTCLAIHWPDFDSYYRQALTRSARKSYRTNLKRAMVQGSVIHRYSVVTDIDRAMHLISNVYQRYNTPMEPWMKRILHFAHHINATWLTAEIDSQIVGCELMLGDGESSYLSALGLDYNFRYIYFQLFYEDIRQAINGGLRELRAGSTVFEVKQRMGFQQMDNGHVLFTASSKSLNRLFGRLAPWFNQHGPARQELAWPA